VRTSLQVLIIGRGGGGENLPAGAHYRKGGGVRTSLQVLIIGRGEWVRTFLQVLIIGRGDGVRTSLQVLIAGAHYRKGGWGGGHHYKCSM